MTISEEIISQLPADEAERRNAALELDAQDSIAHLRSQFIFPTKADLKSKTILDKQSQDGSEREPCLYLCGNSLGLQPKSVAARVGEHLASWARKGVTGHFVKAEDSSLQNWVDSCDAPCKVLADMMGARPGEVAAMETLTANLHMLMASFYRPNERRYKIIIEGKAFPSDHYAVESQLRQHGLSATHDLVTIFPEEPAQVLTTEQILSVIDKHASTTALVLLPGIQYYTGQLLDISRITAHAHSYGLIIGWDLAHAAGNVPLKLHDWDVDFAVWCHYKYINSGPGAIGGLFVNERHGQVDTSALAAGDLDRAYRHRLAGWWGVESGERFRMSTEAEGSKGATAFVPRPGAAGFQVGNPCIIALAVLQASLDIFDTTDMQTLRAKSVAMTAFLEQALDHHVDHFWDGLCAKDDKGPPYWIITPRNPQQRGAQLSVQLRDGMMDQVMEQLDRHGVVIDERKPDVVRVAPAPLYNSFEDCWRFAYIFNEICRGILDNSYVPKLGPC